MTKGNKEEEEEEEGEENEEQKDLEEEEEWEEQRLGKWFISYQLVPGPVHLRTPLDGVVEFVMVDVLLFQGLSIVPPWRGLNQTLQHGGTRLTIVANK